MNEDLIGATSVRRGHFLLESGHHGDLWLALELLCLRPWLIERSVMTLVAQLEPYDIEMVCGPLNEGAFVALLVAERMQVEFCYAERIGADSGASLFPVIYRLPLHLRDRARGRRVAILNDVTNAGSAVRGAYADLLTCQAIPVVIGSLLVLGEAMAQFAAEEGISLVSVAAVDNQIWQPAACPLCAAGVPLEQV